jgi:hypothetical protein
MNEYLMLERDDLVDRMIVIAPNAYKEDWGLEAARFMPWVPFHVYESGRTKDADRFLRERNGPVWGMSINYEAFISDEGAAYIGKLITPRTLLVFDESIKLKNPTGLVSTRSVTYSGPAGFVRVMTGLPLVQGPQDLYQQLNVIRKLPGDNFFAFRNRYCKMGGFKRRKVVGIREDKAEDLQRLIASTAFVAKRKDWGKVTVPEFYSEKIPMMPDQQQAYRTMNQEMILALESGSLVTAEMIITKAMKLQQISSGFVIDDEGKAQPLMDTRKIPKLVRLREVLEEQIEGKVIIPFHFAYSVDALLKELADFNPATIRGDAWMKKAGRNATDEKARFNKDPNCRVIVVNITATKYGHDLSGTKGNQCGHMLFYENNYSLDDRTQIEMRNVTSEHDWVNVYIDFVSSRTDAAIVEALVKKLGIAEAIIGSYGLKMRDGVLK